MWWCERAWGREVKVRVGGRGREGRWYVVAGGREVKVKVGGWVSE